MDNNKLSIIAIIIILGVLIFMGWFFWDILVYMLVSLALCFLGQPIMKLLAKIQIKNWQMPKALASAITLIVIVGVIVLAGYFLIPVVMRELTSLMAIDPQALSGNIANWLNGLDPMLRRFGLLNDNEHFSTFVMEEMQRTIDKIDMSNVVSDTFHVASKLILSLFCIMFMTFFALKDNGIFFRMIKKWLPKRFHQNFTNILNATGEQLTSYFVGVFMDMLIIAVLETILCLILRVPKPLLIGTLGGLLNIIPFVGPILSAVLGVIIALTSMIASDPGSSVIVSTIVKVIAIVVLAKGLDVFIFQPQIYGKRTHTHPLEIFIVILMAAYIGGVFAIFFAVPGYTLLRIVVNEFFGAYFSEDDDLTGGGTKPPEYLPEESTPPIKEEAYSTTNEPL
ncbi:MAG: AI-2E family transporter [Bacteroidales bacterium]|nr:AI-2E family transporter [Bacteroidales bacterium]